MKKVNLRTLEEWKKLLKAETGKAENWKGTIYDRQNKLTLFNHETIYESKDLLFLTRKSSDQRKGLMVLFRIGKNSPYWWRWTPTKEQAVTMGSLFGDLYWMIESENERCKDA